MIEEAAIVERGRALGLNPRRKSVGEVGPRSKRKWRIIPAKFVQKGDTWADHGVVRVHVSMEATCIIAGEPIRDYGMENDALLKVFTEVDMRYGKIDGKGKVHITVVSMDRDGYVGTACGLEGQMTMVPDSEVKRVCAACTAAME